MTMRMTPAWKTWRMKTLTTPKMRIRRWICIIRLCLSWKRAMDSVETVSNSFDKQGLGCLTLNSEFLRDCEGRLSQMNSRLELFRYLNYDHPIMNMTELTKFDEHLTPHVWLLSDVECRCGLKLSKKANGLPAELVTSHIKSHHDRGESTASESQGWRRRRRRRRRRRSRRRRARRRRARRRRSRRRRTLPTTVSASCPSGLLGKWSRKTRFSMI